MWRQVSKKDYTLSTRPPNRPPKAHLLLAFDASWCSQTRVGGWAVVGQRLGTSPWIESGFLDQCPDSATAETRAMVEALRLLNGITLAGPAVLLTDCRVLVDIITRAETQSLNPDKVFLIETFRKYPNLYLTYLHRRSRRMRLVHYLANARRLEAELIAYLPSQHS